MKRNALTVLSLSTLLICGTTTAFAQEVPTSVIENTAAETTISALPERYLAYGRITDIQKEKDVIKSITVKDVKDNIVVYHISDETLCLDSGKGMKMDLNDLKVNDGVYFYHSPAMTASIPPQTTAEAIVSNIPMDISCAHLHTVEGIEQNEQGTVIKTDQGGFYITIGRNANVTAYDNNSTFDLKNLKEGDRIFTWYDVIATVYPGQAGVNRVVVVPAAEEQTDSSPTKISYSISDVTMKNELACVPLRETADALGLTLAWNCESRTATLKSDTRTMNLTEGKDLYVSTTTIPDAVGMTSPGTLGVAPFVGEDGTMYVPAEAFEWLLGYDVTKNNNSVTIAEKV